MSDMRDVIVPRSDQLNSDDLIAGPMTVTITGVSIKSGSEQPVAISFEGDNGKPYKACKSMCRVLVTAWGPDSKKYVGRSMTLYRDASVKWGGMEVGGIRISHMSDLEKPLTMALTMTKGSRKPYIVKPLTVAKQTRDEEVPACVSIEQAAELERLCKEARSAPAAILQKAGVNTFAEVPARDYPDMKAYFDGRIAKHRGTEHHADEPAV